MKLNILPFKNSHIPFFYRDEGFFDMMKILVDRMNIENAHFVMDNDNIDLLKDVIGKCFQMYAQKLHATTLHGNKANQIITNKINIELIASVLKSIPLKKSLWSKFDWEVLNEAFKSFDLPLDSIE